MVLYGVQIYEVVPHINAAVYNKRKVLVGRPGMGIAVLFAVLLILLHSEKEAMTGVVSLHGDGCVANTW